jgi:hypothetical protein
MAYQIVLALLLVAWAPANSPVKKVEIAQSENWQEELQQINKQLDDLKDLRDRYDASATRHENDAMRWQFEQNLKQESRRAYKQAELDRAAEKKIQVQIDELEARKAEILKQHPNANPIEKSP